MSLFYIDPVLTLEPEVATFLPNQEEIILSCTTNSDRLSVRWSSGDSGQILGFNAIYRAELSSMITSFNCSVIDTGADTILISAIVPVISVQGMLVTFDITVCTESSFYCRDPECQERW